MVLLQLKEVRRSLVGSSVDPVEDFPRDHLSIKLRGRLFLFSFGLLIFLSFFFPVMIVLPAFICEIPLPFGFSDLRLDCRSVAASILAGARLPFFASVSSRMKQVTPFLGSPPDAEN